MRFNQGKPMLYWLTGAATLLLATAQPVWGECPAEQWDSKADINVDDSQYSYEHIATGAKFELKQRFWACGLKMETVSSFKPEFNNLSFRCTWGTPTICESTRSICLHRDDEGVCQKHRVFLVLSRTEVGGVRKRMVTIDMEDASGQKHAGVAHGTGDE